MTAAEKARYSKLADKSRMSMATPAELVELEQIENAMWMAQKEASKDRKPLTGWWQLPVAASCWRADARR